MPEPSDVTLVRRSIAGDREAFVELIQRHGQPLTATIRYRIEEPHHAEDVFQETLLQAWVGICRLRNPAKVRAWLLQIARNRCRDFQRSRQRRHKPTEERRLAAHLNRFGRALAKRDEAVVEVVEALGRLPAAERQAARFFYLKGLTISEIARRSRCPEGTIKRRLYQARQHLRRALGVTPKSKEKRR